MNETSHLSETILKLHNNTSFTGIQCRQITPSSQIMSWIRDSTLSWIQLLFVKIVKTGKVPKHIAFIMDGNRRFAQKNNVEKGEGHSKGFDKLAETLQWCLDLGIPEVTVYAFSIENFKRSQDEVDTLMELARNKFQRLLDEKELLMERGVCVRVVGRLSLLPPDIRALISEAMLLTKDNVKARLNVAFAYTGRDEIAGAINDIVQGAQEDLLIPDDIDEQLMDKTLQVSAPELLVRTSGELRLSDFLLWQLTDTCLYFSDVLWPEFKIWHLLTAIIYFQRTADNTKEIQETANTRCSNFIKEINEKRIKQLEIYAQAS